MNARQTPRLAVQQLLEVVLAELENECQLALRVDHVAEGDNVWVLHLPRAGFLLFEKMSGVRKLTTFYLTKNDHRWATLSL